MRLDSLAGERAAGKDAEAAACFNCLLLQRGGWWCTGGGDRQRHSRIYTQIGQEKRVLSCLFFLETLDPIVLGFFVFIFFIPTTENAPFPALAECIWGSPVSPF